VDLSPIADLYKSQVYEVARHLGVPQSILDAPPTDGLWTDGRTDEDQLGATYSELETAMEFARTQQWSPEATSDDRSWASTLGLTDRPLEVFVIFTRFHRANLHKMRPIPVCSLARLAEISSLASR
jgi:NAD+ synthase